MEHNNYIEMIEAIRDHAKVVDLSYTMEMNMPFWPTQPKYEAVVVETYEAGGESYHQSIRISLCLISPFSASKALICSSGNSSQGAMFSP